MPAPARSVADTRRPLLTGEAFGQLIRFAIAGVGVTLLSVAIYLTLAERFHIDPMAANVTGHVAGIVVGYLIHSRWSFRAGHARQVTAVIKFAVVSLLAFTLNAAWVLLATRFAHGSAWLAAPAMVFVTPLASFALNRHWVFGQTRPVAVS